MLGNSHALPDSKLPWALNSAAFDKLLAGLDADRNSAGSAYEQLRLRLIHFFEWHGCAFAEELTDEAFDRVTRRLAEGKIVINLPSYCFGIARRLFLEVLAQQGTQHPLWMPRNYAQNLAELQFHASAQQALEESETRELQFACLEACLQRLPTADHDLVLQYYQTELADSGTRIDQRVALAERGGISLSLLRVRVHRARSELKRQFIQKLERSSIESGIAIHQHQRGRKRS